MKKQVLEPAIAKIAKRVAEVSSVSSTGIESYDGRTIQVPNGMSLTTAALLVAAAADNMEQRTEFHRRFPGVLPVEGAWALQQAMLEFFGFAQDVSATVNSFFGSFEIPPERVSVRISESETREVVWGRMALPGFNEKGESGYSMGMSADVGDGIGFVIEAEVKKKHEPILVALANMVEQKLKTNSLYKGRAISLSSRLLNTLEGRPPKGANPTSLQPEFLPTKYRKEDLILSEGLTEDIQANIWNLIEHTDVCRKKGISIKRGVLFSGRYGVGKTMACNVTARIATENGWTFVNVKDAAMFATALEFAKNRAPAVLFVEDIDLIVSGDRSDELNEILLALDGVAKSADVISVFTTNKPQAINASFLREGRIDAKIHLTYPDAGAAIRLVKKVAGQGLVETSAEEDEAIGGACAGMSPAAITEVVRRAGLYAIHEERLTAEAIIRSADAVRKVLPPVENTEGDSNDAHVKSAEKIIRGLADGLGQINGGIRATG